MRTITSKHAVWTFVFLLVGLGEGALPTGWAATPTPSAPPPKTLPDARAGESPVPAPAAAPVPAQPDGEAAPAPAPQLKGAAVTLDGETLFHIYTPFGPYTPEERAKGGTARVLELARDPLFRSGLFTIDTQDGKGRVYYRGDLISVVTPKEAAAAGTTPESLAEQRIDIVEKAIERYRNRRRPTSLLSGVLKSVVSTFCLIALLLGVTRLHHRLVATLRARRLAVVAERAEKRSTSLVRRMLSSQLQALKLLRPAVIVFLIAVYLESVFLFIPITGSFARGILDYILGPLKSLWNSLLANVGNFAFILVVLALMLGVLRVLRWLANEAEQGTIAFPGVAPEWARPMHRIVRLLVIGIVAVVIYPYIPGSSTAAFKGIGIFAGALFTLGASSTAGNFIGGIALMFSGTFRIGDRVTIGEVTGDVVETGVLITRIRTPKNETVSLPNGALLSGRLVNYSAMAREGRLILHTSVTIGYDAPWRKVHELLSHAALRTPGIEAYPTPFVLQKQLNDFFVTYEINAYTRNANSMSAIYGELHQNIQDAFNEAGVEIMSPHYAALRDGKTTTIPSSDRSRDGEPRASVA